MAKFDEKSIHRLFNLNLKNAKAKLASLKYCSRSVPSFQGLSGWVFEQTVQDCLRKELRALRIQAAIREQVSLGGKARADLLIGTLVMEIKARGLFDENAADRYCKYKAAAEKKGYAYLYLTLQETYQPYKKAILNGLGRQNAFFLDTPGDWNRLIKRIVNLLKRKSG
jgi:hypothetical protein